MVDNTVTLAVANGNDDFTHETVKHVTAKVRFLQEYVQRKIVLLAQAPVKFGGQIRAASK